MAELRVGLGAVLFDPKSRFMLAEVLQAYRRKKGKESFEDKDGLAECLCRNAAAGSWEGFDRWKLRTLKCGGGE